ncbi:MAG: sulfotransferase family 2 domain-containing protein [Mesorhizobium sp.]
MLNPKVGSTFLRDALTRALREHKGKSDPSDGRYRFLSMARRFPMAPFGVYWEGLRHPERYEFHALVRNPYARLKSAWKDKFYNGHAKGYARSMRDGELAKMRAFAAANGLPGARDGELVPFDTFLESALTLPLGRMNHHWDAQSEVLMMERFTYARLFHIETERDTALDVIGARLGLPRGWAADGRRNASSTDDLQVFNEANAARVASRFARDFEALGYDLDSWRGL